MKIIRTVKEFKEERAKIGADKSVGFVPTMGGLHEGHMSLVKKCRENNDVTVVSVYLNPTQFNDKNDLNTYPANFDDDKALLEKNGCDILFAPTYSEMYPDDYKYKVTENDFSKLNIQKLAKEVIENTVSQLGGEACESAEYKAVLSPPPQIQERQECL